jgi:ABC-2 type transport system ATP-binding protein
MSFLVTVQNLSRYYEQHCAVNNVSFSLAKGEVLGFLGPNGAGKTTTMQMLTGNLAPTSGAIEINGFDLRSKPLLAKSNLGYLPDVPPLYRELSVNEFLSYCALLHRIPKNQTEKAIKTAKQRCGLEGVGERLIQNLSKGFQQRLGIAQAILHNPPVIILDEPTVGLDPLQIREIRSLIRELGKDHGIILSTHILSEVQESCTHVQIIHQGSLILKKSIAELNQHMQSSTLSVSTRRPIDISKLNTISGIVEIDVKTPQQICIKHAKYQAQVDSQNTPVKVQPEIAEQVAEIIVNAGWGLVELTPIQHSLEDIFIDLTQANLPTAIQL